MVLEERGVNTHKLNKQQLIEILASHDDFRNGKNKDERLLVRFEQRAMFLPKFHPELNPLSECGVGLKCMPRTTATTLLQACSVQ